MNLIVIMLDTLRKDHTGAYGNAWVQTPSIDRFAQRSLLFNRMYPESLPTLLARRALFTGRRAFPSLDWRPWKGETVLLRGWQPLREEDVSLAEVLGAKGYVCGLVADCPHIFKPGQNFTRGFHAYAHIRGQVQDPYRSIRLPEDVVTRYVHEDLGWWAQGRVTQHLRNTFGLRQTEEDYFPARVFQTAAKWLEENRSHEKLFLWVDSFDPHEPWDPPQEYVDLYDPGYSGREFLLPNEGDSSYLSPPELNHCRARYAAEVTFVDKWLGWFLDRLKEMGFWEDSVILLMSDHGMPLGEHGIIAKVPWGIYPELIDVPFMLHVPNVTSPGTHTDVTAQFHDVAPTLLDILDVSPPEEYEFEGESFFTALDSSSGWSRSHIVCGYHENALVIAGDWAYIFLQAESDRKLFNTAIDPKWTDNVYENNPRQVSLLHGLLTEVADPEEIRVDPKINEQFFGVTSSQ